MTARRFIRGMRRYQTVSRKQATRIFQDAAFSIGEDIVSHSPVDTGRFKGNWNASVGVPDTSADYNHFDPAGYSVIARLGAIAARLKLGQVFWFANTIDYSGLLERGHSRQAPTGVVRPAIARLITRLRLRR